MGKDGEAISLIFFDQTSLIPIIEKVTDSKMEQIKLDIKPELLPKRVRFTEHREGGFSGRSGGRFGQHEGHGSPRGGYGSREGGHRPEGGRPHGGSGYGRGPSRGGSGRGGYGRGRGTDTHRGSEPKEYESSRGHKYFGRR
ncbi:Uncharacterised protein [uncultured archaeon]|nr:Uncharacterised protein [uncultured archaeon]